MWAVQGGKNAIFTKQLHIKNQDWNLKSQKTTMDSETANINA